MIVYRYCWSITAGLSQILYTCTAGLSLVYHLMITCTGTLVRTLIFNTLADTIPAAVGPGSGE